MVTQVVPGAKFEVSNVADPKTKQTITFPHQATKKTAEGETTVDVDGISTWDLLNVLEMRVKAQGGDSVSYQMSSCFENIKSVRTWLERENEKNPIV